MTLDDPTLAAIVLGCELGVLFSMAVLLVLGIRSTLAQYRRRK